MVYLLLNPGGDVSLTPSPPNEGEGNNEPDVDTDIDEQQRCREMDKKDLISYTTKNNIIQSLTLQRDLWEIFPTEILLAKNDYFVEVYIVTEWLKVEAFFYEAAASKRDEGTMYTIDETASVKHSRPRGTRELAGSQSS